MNYEFILSIRNMWIGAYWEVWPEPHRVDVWVGVPFGGNCGMGN